MNSYFIYLFVPLFSVAFGKRGPYLYYTSDDGTNPGTPSVLDAAQKYGVPITFFVNGYYLHGSKWNDTQKAESLAHFERIVAEGHVLGDHSYDHMIHNSQLTYPNPYNSYQSWADTFYFGQMNADALWMSMNQTDKLWNRLQTMKRMARMPYANNWRVNMTNGYPNIRFDCFVCTYPLASGVMGAEISEMLHYQGSQVYGWDLEWPTDWNLGLLDTAENILNQVVNMTMEPLIGEPNKVVLLSHDHGFINKTGNPQGQLETFFEEAQAAGYIFRSMDTYHMD